MEWAGRPAGGTSMPAQAPSHATSVSAWPDALRISRSREEIRKKDNFKSGLCVKDKWPAQAGSRRSDGREMRLHEDHLELSRPVGPERGTERGRRCVRRGIRFARWAAALARSSRAPRHDWVVRRARALLNGATGRAKTSPRSRPGRTIWDRRCDTFRVCTISNGTGNRPAVPRRRADERTSAIVKDIPLRAARVRSIKVGAAPVESQIAGEGEPGLPRRRDPDLAGLAAFTAGPAGGWPPGR